MVIAIDGYSSTGKSSLAKTIAKNLGYTHVDSGAMYRAVTLYGLQNFYEGALDEINAQQLIKSLPDINLEFKNVDGANHMFMNGKDVEDDIRTIEVSQFVSKISSYPEIRKFLVQQQRSISKDKDIVMEGRDIGTVVFPDADMKFFIVADVDERARRRYNDMKLNDPDITFEEVKENLVARDKADTEREHSPLKKAPDAIEIDNTHQTKDETVDEMMGIIEEHRKDAKKK